jgi:hypothetical protein
MRIAGRMGGIGIARAAAVAAGLVGGLPGSVNGAGSQTLAALPPVTVPAATVGEARPVPGWTEFCPATPRNAPWMSASRRRSR